MIEKTIIQRSFWALTVTETLEALETSKEGLTEKTAEARLKLFGKNSLPRKIKATRLRIFLNQFRNPLIFLLLVAGVITVVAKDYYESWIIFAAAFLNMLLGFYQENKAENALEHLKSYIKERTRVIRENREYEIDAAELVPGDIIHIAQGDRVPADARLIYVNDLLIDESILTGESLPTQKNTSPISFQAVIGDQKNMVFSGTAVVQGFANAVICRTGLDAEIGRIAAMVRNHRKLEQTPLQKAIINFSLKASLILLTLTTIIFLAGLLTNQSPLEMFLISVAILVAAVPEGLPAAMTIILAIGVQRLAKKNGVVRKLLAAETLGGTSIILTDKTGTLTKAQMTLAKISPMAGDSITQDLIMKIAVINSDVVIENPKDPPKKWRVVGRPLESAVIKSAAEIGILAPETKKELRVLSYLPFNSFNKYSASVVKRDSQELLTVFGAPEILLKLSTEIPEIQKKEYLHAINQMAHSGERVLGVAIKDVSKENFLLTASTKISGLKFLGTISFRDPLREGVQDTLHRTEQAGIRTVIVTGDHRGTAVAVAKELGLSTKDENIIDGPELDALTAEELERRLPFINIVSRVSPEGKVKIAQGFQKLGHIVAMTGDGINDAPSLKQADIGVAMGSGADVAKDIAELVLLDNNYETIVEAISEGRRITENIRKVIVYLFSSVADELILIGGALLFGIAPPLNAVQILWVNLITDSLPAIALAFEDHIDYLMEKPKKIAKSLLDREMKFLIFTIGIPTSLLLFGLYYGLLKLGFDPALVQTFIFASFGTYSLFLIFSVRSLQKSIFKYNPFSNLYLLIGVILGITLMILAIYLPFLQNLLNTASLPPLWLFGIAAIGFINILAIEVGKLIIKRL
jgi:Ca2+-transporting ATPase